MLKVIPTINYADISAIHAVKLDMSYHHERMLGGGALGHGSLFLILSFGKKKNKINGAKGLKYARLFWWIL